VQRCHNQRGQGPDSQGRDQFAKELRQGLQGS
jgi:hypothetical protein